MNKKHCPPVAIYLRSLIVFTVHKMRGNGFLFKFLLRCSWSIKAREKYNNHPENLHNVLFTFTISVADPAESNFSIPDPGSRVKKAHGPGSGSTTKNSNIFNPTNLPNLSEIWFGMFITDPDFFSSPDPGSRGQKGLNPGSGSATVWTQCKKFKRLF